MTASVKALLRRAKDGLLLRSLKAAGREQGLLAMAQKLSELGDIQEQYTTFAVDTDYLRWKVLLQNAFQLRFAAPDLPPGDGLVVDIGDSSGRHIAALKALHQDCRARYLSVNIDPVAVAKIRAKGLEAVRARAEDLAAQGLKAEVFLLFETLEHLHDPFSFLHHLSSTSHCRRLVVTVPWVRRSRLGLQHIREGNRQKFGAERVHLLELCPEDLGLLFAFTGWKVEREEIYRQYPLLSPLRATREVWRRLDFEGFYAASLSRDATWSSLYESW